jgi:hypothetical protein
MPLLGDMPSIGDLASWVFQSAAWDILKFLSIPVVVTVMTRIGFWIFGRENVPRKKEVAFWFTGIIGGTILLLLIYSALARGNSSSNRPEMRCTLLQADCGVAPYKQPFESQAKNVISVILWARIVNNGSPSSAWKWRLKAQLVSGPPVDSDTLETPVLYFPAPRSGQQPVTLDSGQYLMWQLMDNPLPKGASKTGWIGFTFDESLFDEFKRPGVKLSLEFEDIEGKTISAQFMPPMGWAHVASATP